VSQGKGGGPKLIVFDDEQIKQVEKLSAMLNKEQLADFMGVSHVTMIAIEGRQPEVSLAYKRGKAKAIAGMAQSLVAQARDGNVSAAMFYLKTQAGWKERQALDITSGGKKIENNFIITPVSTDKNA